MSWFKRKIKGILTSKEGKKNFPSGLWLKLATGKIESTTNLIDNYFVCPKTNLHLRIEGKKYFDFLFDNSDYKLFAKNLKSTDFLNFTDKKSYNERLEENYSLGKTDDAISFATGYMTNISVIIGAMNFEFIGGSMGSVVGEKISLAIDYAIKNESPLILITKSGGIRMMEAGIGLMQMAKVSAKTLQLSKKKIPYISILTDPTTGGVLASFALQADVVIAEPKALIGFAGPKVIKELTKKTVTRDSQSAETLLKNGFIDMIVHRKDLKSTVTRLLSLLSKRSVSGSSS